MNTQTFGNGRNTKMAPALVARPANVATLLPEIHDDAFHLDFSPSYTGMLLEAKNVCFMSIAFAMPCTIVSAIPQQLSW